MNDSGEEWAETAPSGTRSQETPILKVAHVVGVLSINTDPARYVQTLAEGLRIHGVTSAVFSTEWGASVGVKPSDAGQPRMPEIYRNAWRAPECADEGARARAITEAIAQFAPDAALYHNSFPEPIMSRVAACKPAPLQIHLSHDREIEAEAFDARAYRFHRADTELRGGALSFPWIPVASDVEERLAREAPVSRRSMGIDTAVSVSATFGNLDRVCSPAFIATITEILIRFPTHCHLFAGQGIVRAARQAFHAEGVLQRVRFLGPMGDIAPLLPALDFYLAPFPNLDRNFILDAMGAGKPVVIHRKAADTDGASLGEVVGEDDLVVDNHSAYVESVSRMIRKADLRQKLSEGMRARFAAEHSSAAMGKRYLTLLRTLLG